MNNNVQRYLRICIYSSIARLVFQMINFYTPQIFQDHQEKNFFKRLFTPKSSSKPKWIYKPGESTPETQKKVESIRKYLDVIDDLESDANDLVFSKAAYGSIFELLKMVEELVINHEDFSFEAHEGNDIKQLKSLSRRLDDIEKDHGKQYSELAPSSRFDRLPREILLQILEDLDLKSLLSIFEAYDIFLVIFSNYSDQISKNCLYQTLQDSNFIQYFPRLNNDSPWIICGTSIYKFTENSNMNLQIPKCFSYITEMIEFEQGIIKVLKAFEGTSNIRYPGSAFRKPWQKQWNHQLYYRALIQIYNPASFLPTTTTDPVTNRGKIVENSIPLPKMPNLSPEQLNIVYKAWYGEDLLPNLTPESLEITEKKLINILTRAFYRDILRCLTVRAGMSCHDALFENQRDLEFLDNLTWEVIRKLHPLQIYNMVDIHFNVHGERIDRVRFPIGYIANCDFIRVFYNGCNTVIKRYGGAVNWENMDSRIEGNKDSGYTVVNAKI